MLRLQFSQQRRCLFYYTYLSSFHPNRYKSSTSVNDILSDTSSLDDFSVYKIIKSIVSNNSKKKDLNREKNALNNAMEVFNKASKPAGHLTINSLLHLFYDLKTPQNILLIWNDIEIYHNNLNESTDSQSRSHLSYAMLIKNSIRTNKVSAFKCIQILKWMEIYNYKLSIHGTILSKLITKCCKNQNLNHLKYVHSLIKNELIETNLNGLITQNVLINAYGIKCKQVNHAEEIFNSISEQQKNEIIIGSMMKVYIENGLCDNAFDLYYKYRDSTDIDINADILNTLAIKACVKSNNYEKGLEIHNDIQLHSNINSNTFLQTSLIDFYGHFNDISNAKKLFNSVDLNSNTIAPINAMIKGYITNNDIESGLILYKKFNKQSDNRTHVLIIDACIKTNNFKFGNDIIKKIIEKNNNEDMDSRDDVQLKSAIITFYGTFGEISCADQIFNELHEDDMDIDIINAYMTILIDNEYSDRALRLYTKYKDISDIITHCIALKGCIRCDNIELGYNIINEINEYGMDKDSNNSLQIRNLLIEYYSHFGDLESAFNIFNGINKKQKDIQCIGAIISGCILNENYNRALSLYDSYFLFQDDRSHVLALKACGYIRYYDRGKQIIISNKLRESNNIQIQNSLISFYGNCNDIVSCLDVFGSICNRDIISINSMMDAYRSCKLFIECIQLFDNMHHTYSVEPDLISHIIVIKSCTEGLLIERGERLHSQMDNKLLNNVSIQINLINMYSKFGKIDKFEEIFNNIRSFENDKYRNNISIWNSMINAYGSNKCLKKVREIYDLLCEIGLIPNRTTYISLINAYSYLGDLREVNNIWYHCIDDQIKYDNNVMISIIKCLSNRGYLKQSLNLINKHNSNKFNSKIWIILLNACNNWNNCEIGEKVYLKIREMFDNDNDVDIIIHSTNIMLKIYKSNNNISKKNSLEREINKKGLKKQLQSYDNINYNDNYQKDFVDEIDLTPKIRGFM